MSWNLFAPAPTVLQFPLIESVIENVTKKVTGIEYLSKIN